MGRETIFCSCHNFQEQQQQKKNLLISQFPPSNFSKSDDFIFMKIDREIREHKMLVL